MMSFRSLVVFAVAGFALTGADGVARAEQIVQLPLSFNADVVREPGGTVTGGGIDPSVLRIVNGNLVFDPGGRALVSQSDAAANDSVDPHGLPDNGLLAVPGGAIQLGPYNGNNALRLGTFGESAAGLGFSGQQLAGFDSLDIYFTASGLQGNIFVGAKMWATVDYELLNNLVLGRGEWVGGEPSYVVLSDLDRTGNNGLGFEDIDAADIFRWRIPIGTGTPLNSVGIRLDPEDPDAQAVAILAAAGVRVPEPSAALALLGAGWTALLRRRRQAAARRRS